MTATTKVVPKVAKNNLKRSIKVECRIIPAYVRKANIKTTLMARIIKKTKLPSKNTGVELKLNFSII